MKVSDIMFALLRFGVNGTELGDDVKNLITPEMMSAVFKLSKKHDFPFDEQWAFTRTSLRKLQDENIVDYIERNARDPMRKLGKDDRLVGSARLCLEYGVKPDSLAVAIACAMHYEEPTDEFALQLKKLREEEGYDAILSKVCSLEPNGELGLLVKEKIALIKEWGWLK